MEEPEIGSFSIHSQSKKPVYSTMWGRTCFFFVLLSALLMTGCKGRKSDLASRTIDSLGYTSITKDVVTFISDSGVTKYKMVTDLWLSRSEPEEQWVFPSGLYLEQFDTLFHKQASIVSDTAYYHVSRHLWELVGNIHILNREGTQFFGNRLFWDEDNELVYSHDSIRIVRGPGEELRSRFGFKSNQYMTKYELYDTAGHMDVNEDGEVTSGPATATPADSVMPLDSVAPPPMRPRDSLLMKRSPGRSNPYRPSR